MASLELDGDHLFDYRSLFRISLGLISLMYEVPHEGVNKAS